jgi:CRISPR-associated endonuclease Csn1
MSIALSFDIGHSSVGWAALNLSHHQPEVLGCGAVTFPAEDCQNQQRAGFRRQRRHIAATRNRIKRLESFLVQVGAIAAEDVEYCREHPNPWPWLLAAQVIVNNRELNWRELWAVIRWYAHNRGYDGNALWAGEDSDPDVKKVQAARGLMDRCDTGSMCETICELMDIDLKSDQNPTLRHYFKGENAAFPRDVVVAEVRQVLERHLGGLTGVTQELIRALLDDWQCASEVGFDAKLPVRYFGGLLFGQMKPRFENRIIPTCRITGEKTPSKHSRAFYRFRWAMLMGNLRVVDQFESGSRALSRLEREQLNTVMEDAGYMTKTTLKKALEQDLGLEPSNLDAMLLIPEMEKALTLDPALREMSGTKYKKIWKKIPDSWQPTFLNQLFNARNYRSKPASLAQWRSRIEAKGELSDEFDAVLREAYDAECETLAKKKGAGALPTYQGFLNRPLRIAQEHMASGRAPYARVKLVEAVAAVMKGEEDPRAVGGALEESIAVRERQQNIGIDQSSNNHLVRHRLKIFEKTLIDLVNHYAEGDASRVEWVGVEVVRDIVEFSGKTAKEKAKILGEQLWHHRKISKYLEEEKESSEGSWDINAGLIKKVRIADDLDWKCPYTGQLYNLNQIIHGDVDREHIIPRSKRPTDAMHALVLTFSELNREKGARTAMQFIEDTKDDSRTLTPKQFQEFVSKLKKSNGPSKDDERRCMKRKIALLTCDYEPRGKAKEKSDGESVDGFTEGSLTQTSYINKLAAQQVLHWFSKQVETGAKLPEVIQLSGSVTAATRRGWNLFGSLEEACPETRGKSKTEIREITHLHHALDAIVIGLSAYYFPKDGRLWALLSKRSIGKPADQTYLRTQLGDLISFSSSGSWQLEPLKEPLMMQIVERLKEKRVVRHNPRTMRGLRIQQNVWRVEAEDPDDPSKMLIRMKPRNEDGVKVEKQKSERKTKLFGSSPKGATGKLKDLKGALIVEDNYGVALDPEPKVIPYQQVWGQIQHLRKQNGGRPIRVLRNGNIIRVKEGRYAGLWRVHSIKDANMGLVLDIASPELVRAGNGVVGAKMNVRLNTLLSNGLELLNLDSSSHEF